jgi:hypothetical protein
VLSVLETTGREGVRPAEQETGTRPPRISAERVRLVYYQLVHG